MPVQRLDLVIGAGVNQQRKAFGSGQDRRDRRPINTGKIAQQRDPDGHHRARIAGADHGADLAALEHVVTDVQGGLRFGEHHFHRRVVHHDDFSGVLDGQIKTVAIMLSQFLLQDRPIADQDHTELEFPRRQYRAFDGGLGGEIPAHRIQCDPHRAPAAILGLRHLATPVGAAMAADSMRQGRLATLGA